MTVTSFVLPTLSIKSHCYSELANVSFCLLSLNTTTVTQFVFTTYVTNYLDNKNVKLKLYETTEGPPLVMIGQPLSPTLVIQSEIFVVIWE